MHLKESHNRHYIARVFREIVSTEGSAHTVAFSFALGTFIALLPTIGFGAFVGILLLLIFPSLHKPGLLLAFVVWNPLVQIPIYSLSIAIGSIIYSGSPVVSFDIELIDHVYKITRRVLVGNIIVSTSLSVASYLSIFILIRALKKKTLESKNAKAL